MDAPHLPLAPAAPVQRSAPLEAERATELAAELASLRAEMQDFTYTVSHDLRASLRHVLSYVQLVQEDGAAQLTPELQGFLQTAADSARHMGVLMDGLVELARLGTVPLDCVPLSLQAVVQEVWQEAAADLRLRDPARNVVWEVAPDVPPVCADAALLRLALQHVLDNAVKFTARQPAALVRISARRLPAQGARPALVQLEVSDNGAGFNPALQSRLFHPFQRLHSARQFDGIGMGLALTRKIVQRLGGSMDARGEPDAGCSLYLCLPAVDPADLLPS